MIYYAFAHSQGADTAWQGESASGTLHIFEGKVKRDDWVNGGPAYRHESGFRTMMKAKHPKVQEIKRAWKKGGDLPHVYHGEDEVVVYGHQGRVRTRAESYDDLPHYAR